MELELIYEVSAQQCCCREWHHTLLVACTLVANARGVWAIVSACGCKDGYVGARTSHFAGSECTVECAHGRWDGFTGCACERGWFGFACKRMSDDDPLEP